MLIDPAAWMKVKKIMLSGRSQARKKIIYSIIPFNGIVKKR